MLFKVLKRYLKRLKRKLMILVPGFMILFLLNLNRKRLKMILIMPGVLLIQILVQLTIHTVMVVRMVINILRRCNMAFGRRGRRFGGRRYGRRSYRRGRGGIRF